MARSSSSDGGGYFFEVGFDEEVTDPLTMEHGHHLGFGALRKGIAQQARTGRSMTNASNDPQPTFPDLVPARMLNEYAYCPRLAYLEWVQGEFHDSADTAEGRFQHRRVDVPSGELPLEALIASLILSLMRPMLQTRFTPAPCCCLAKISEPSPELTSLKGAAMLLPQ